MSFASEQRERVRPVLPLAPMLDVLFLLLIFFMTASTFRAAEPTIEVDLTPVETGENPDMNQLTQVITFTAENEIFIDDRAFTLEEAKAFIERIASTAPDAQLAIRGDQEGDWGIGVTLQDFARESGFEQVAISTAEAETTNAPTP